MSITLPDPGPPNAEFAQTSDRTRMEKTAEALESRGFKTHIAESAEHARRLVFEAIPEGAEVHSALSETLHELGITAEIDESGRYESVRAKLGNSTERPRVARCESSEPLPTTSSAAPMRSPTMARSWSARARAASSVPTPTRAET